MRFYPPPPLAKTLLETPGWEFFIGVLLTPPWEVFFCGGWGVAAFEEPRCLAVLFETGHLSSIFSFGDLYLEVAQAG